MPNVPSPATCPCYLVEPKNGTAHATTQTPTTPSPISIPYPQPVAPNYPQAPPSPITTQNTYLSPNTYLPQYPTQNVYPAQNNYPALNNYPAQNNYASQNNYPAQNNYPTQNNYPQQYYPQFAAIGFIPVVFFPYCADATNNTTSNANLQPAFPNALQVPYPCSLCNPQHGRSLEGTNSFQQILNLANIDPAAGNLIKSPHRRTRARKQKLSQVQNQEQE